MQLLQKTKEVLEHLVAFDTSSHKSNKPLVDWVKTYLERHGVAAQTFDDATGSKQNLIATLGVAGEKGIVLSGHTDVVPADAARWSSDPFMLRLEDGKLFGRGTTDMKGFLSIVLAAVPDIAKRNLKHPITLAFTYDEEVGCLGAPELVARLPRNQRVIVGEPTSLVPGDRHKGGRIQTLTLTGVPAHSGTPELGVNAIAHAAHALGGLAALERHFAQSDEDFKTTLAVSKIDGGSAINIVPDRCSLTWMLRPARRSDGDYAETVLNMLVKEIDAELKAQNARAGAQLQTLVNVPPFVRGLLDERFARLTNGHVPTSLSFGTEAGIFSEAGHDVIVCGPGDMAQGHTVDEYIEVQALAEGCKFIEAVVEDACA